MAGTTGSGEALPDWQRAVADLGQHLKQIVSDGTFSFGRTHNSYEPPGISIQGMGAVGLPLFPQHAREIAALCCRSTYANMSRPNRVGILDEGIRKTKEMDMSRVEFRNPRWSEFLMKAKIDACAGLGVRISPDNVTLEPYKMLLYAEGSKFQLHKDIEKTTGMFATLVICLPSEHTGGELFTRHMDELRIMETGPYSKFDITCLAWYTDVEHEVKPVRSGYRWCLTYGMVCTPRSARPSVTHIMEERNTTAGLVRRWLSDRTSPPFLLYPLEHQYTLASLKMCMLKGNDAARCNHLKSTCKELQNITFFLAGLSRSLFWNPQGPPEWDYYKEVDMLDKEGDEDCEEEDDIDEVLRLHTVVDECGNAFRYHTGTIDKNQTIDPSVFLRPRTYEQHGGDHYSDTRANDIERIYQFTVLLLVKTSDMDTAFPKEGSRPKDSALDNTFLQLRIATDDS